MKDINDYYQFVSKSIKLNNYYDSEGFVGFFYLTRKFSKKFVEKAVSIASSYNAKCSGKLYVASNLMIDGGLSSLIDNYEFSETDIEDYITPLLSEGIITAQADPFGEEIDLQNIKRVTEPIFQRVCFLVMGLGGVIGHVFFFLEGEDIIIYPHDDVGLGVFSMNHRESHIEKFFEGVDTKNFAIKRKQTV